MLEEGKGGLPPLLKGMGSSIGGGKPPFPISSMPTHRVSLKA